MTPLPDFLPAAIEQRLREELGAGERLLWAAQPLPRLARRRLLPMTFFGMFWTGMSGFIFVMFVVLGNDVAPPAGFPGTLPAGFPVPAGPDVFDRLLPAGFLGFFMLFGVLMMCAPLFGGRSARRTVYAVTDRRALTVYTSIGGTTTVTPFGPERLGSMARKVRPDGSGDLVFEEFRERRGSSTTTVTRGFLGIPNVREVEKLITEKLVRGRVRGVEGEGGEE